MNPQKPAPRDHGLRLVWLAIFIAVAGIAVPIPSAWEFYNIPAGTACRPMQAFIAFALAGIGTPIVSILLASLARPKNAAGRRLAKLAAVLSLVPPVLYFCLFRWIIYSHQLTLLP